MFRLTTGPGWSARRTALAAPGDAAGWAGPGVAVRSGTITSAASAEMVGFIGGTCLCGVNGVDGQEGPSCHASHPGKCGLGLAGTGRPNPVRDQPESGTEQGERRPDCPNQGIGDVATDDLVTSGSKSDGAE